jgi:hypothetical protein
MPNQPMTWPEEMSKITCFTGLFGVAFSGNWPYNEQFTRCFLDGSGAAQAANLWVEAETKSSWRESKS